MKKKERIKKPLSLYVHIPFCEHICAYCDFPKLIKNSYFIEPYFKALLFEIDDKSINQVDTIYIGGGTPTSLDDDKFEILLKSLSKYLSNDYEFSVESNVESLSDTKIELFKKYGVNRISLGIQSFDNNVLKYLDRKHTKEECINLIKKLKSNGFSNINCDLIYGGKFTTLESLKNDLDILLSLDIDHISCYSLIIEENTKLYIDGDKELDDEILRNQYDFILSYLRKNNFKRYEVSNFAKPNKECKHNLTYWKNKHYHAVGLGAAGYIGSIRYKNTRNLNKYIAHEYVEEKEIVDTNDHKKYFLMTNLRLEDGFLLEDYKQIYNSDFLLEYSKELKELVNSGLLIVDKTHVKPTDNGIMLLDIILRKLYLAIN